MSDRKPVNEHPEKPDVRAEAARGPAPVSGLWIRGVKLFRSGPALPAMFFAAGAVFFGLGIILMANAISPEELGFVALFLVILRVGSALGPAGLEVMLIRARPDADLVPYNPLLRATALTTVLSVLVFAPLYDFSAVQAAALGIGLVSASFWRMFTALDQSRARAKQALALSQLPNVVALLMGLLALFAGFCSADSLTAIAAGGYLLSALISWRLSGARNWDTAHWQANHASLADRLSLTGLAASAMLLAQIERFLIPSILTFEDLALFAAVASLAVAPLKLLTAASKFYLVPIAAAADTTRKLRRVVLHQGLAIALLAVVASGAVLAISPWLWDRVLPATYDVENSLVLAVLVIGFARLYTAIVMTVLRSSADSRVLMRSNIGAWLCIGASSGLAAAFSQGQLVVFVWMLTLGISVYAAGATVMLVGLVRRPRRNGVLSQ